MIQFGFSLGFAGLQSYQPQLSQETAAQQSAAPQAQTPQHTTANTTMMAPAMPFSVAMMSPAYMMAYPQMMGPTGTMPMGAPGMTATQGTSAGGAGHVTANPTNSMASPAMSGGYGGYGGVGGFGGFAMPVMMLSPVFFQMGYPMVFQGSQAQPPVAPAVDDVADQVGVDEVVQAPPEPEFDVPDPVAQPPVNTDGVVIDVVPETEEPSTTLPALPITELGAEDFAKYRLLDKSKQQETSLSLELTTQDGDRITLDFTQLDSLEMTRFSGRTLDGAKVMDESMREESDRVVNMEVSGDLTDAEKAAVDEVLSTIVEAVNKFFAGDVGAAVAKLKQMDFDGQQLSELSLNMSMSRSADISRAYHNGADYLHDLQNRDADINQALEFIASEQKRLIEMAKDFFDAPSAAKLVRSLVPPLLSDPFSQLNEQIAAANGGEAPVASTDETPVGAAALAADAADDAEESKDG